MKLSFILVLLFLSPMSHAQDLLNERIWKISSRKRSIFLDKGIFHSMANPMQQDLKGIRNSYVPARGYERIVFDFSGNKPPKVYGKISGEEKKVFIDFFNTNLATSMGKLKNIKLLSSVDFFSIDKNTVSVELTFKAKASYDIFYLENPGRLVIDAKK